METKTLKSWIRGAKETGRGQELFPWLSLAQQVVGACSGPSGTTAKGRKDPTVMGASLGPWFKELGGNEGQTWASLAPQSLERLVCGYSEITGRLGLCETSHLPAQWALWKGCISSHDSSSTAGTNVMGLLMFVKCISLGNLLYCQHSLRWGKPP